MRGRVVVALMALGVAGAVPTYAQNVEVGVRGGLNWATVGWSEAPDGGEFDELERRRSAGFGAFVGFDLTGPLRLRGEVLMSPKGFTEVRGDGSSAGVAVDYLEVPILLGVRLPTESDRWEPELYLGGWFAKEQSCDARVVAGEIDLEFDCDEVPDDPILRETTDWGIAAGLTLNFDVSGPFRALLDARYTRGLRNIDTEPEAENLNVTNRGLTLSAGLSVRVGR